MAQRAPEEKPTDPSGLGRHVAERISQYHPSAHDLEDLKVFHGRDLSTAAAPIFELLSGDRAELGFSGLMHLVHRGGEDLDALRASFFSARVRGRRLTDLNPYEYAAAYMFASGSREHMQELNQLTNSTSDRELSSFAQGIMKSISTSGRTHPNEEHGWMTNAVGYTASRIGSQEVLKELTRSLYGEIRRKAEEGDGSPPDSLGYPSDYGHRTSVAMYMSVAQAALKIRDPAFRGDMAEGLLEQAFDYHQPSKRAAAVMIASGSATNPIYGKIPDPKIIEFIDSCMHNMRDQPWSRYGHAKRSSSSTLRTIGVAYSSIESDDVFTDALNQLIASPEKQDEPGLHAKIVASRLGRELSLELLTNIGYRVRDQTKIGFLVERLVEYLDDPVEYMRSQAADAIGRCMTLVTDGVTAERVVSAVSGLRNHPVAEVRERVDGLLTNFSTIIGERAGGYDRIPPGMNWLNTLPSRIQSTLSSRPRCSDIQRVSYLNRFLVGYTDDYHYEGKVNSEWMGEFVAGVKSPRQLQNAVHSLSARWVQNYYYGKSLSKVLYTAFDRLPFANQRVAVDGVTPLATDGVLVAGNLAARMKTDDVKLQALESIAVKRSQVALNHEVSDVVSTLLAGLRSDDSKVAACNSLTRQWVSSSQARASEAQRDTFVDRSGRFNLSGTMFPVVQKLRNKRRCVGIAQQLVEGLDSHKVSDTQHLVGLTHDVLRQMDGMDVDVSSFIPTAVYYLADTEGQTRQHGHILARTLINVLPENQRWSVIEAVAENLANPLLGVREDAGVFILDEAQKLGRKSEAEALIVERNRKEFSDTERIAYLTTITEERLSAESASAVLNAFTEVCGGMQTDKSREAAIDLIDGATVLESTGEEETRKHDRGIIHVNRFVPRNLAAQARTEIRLNFQDEESRVQYAIEQIHGLTEDMGWQEVGSRLSVALKCGVNLSKDAMGDQRRMRILNELAAVQTVKHRFDVNDRRRALTSSFTDPKIMVDQAIPLLNEPLNDPARLLDWVKDMSGTRMHKTQFGDIQRLRLVKAVPSSTQIKGKDWEHLGKTLSGVALDCSSNGMRMNCFEAMLAQVTEQTVDDVITRVSISARSFEDNHVGDQRRRRLIRLIDSVKVGDPDSSTRTEARMAVIATMSDPQERLNFVSGLLESATGENAEQVLKWAAGFIPRLDDMQRERVLTLVQDRPTFRLPAVSEAVVEFNGKVVESIREPSRKIDHCVTILSKATPDTIVETAEWAVRLAKKVGNDDRKRVIAAIDDSRFKGEHARLAYNLMEAKIGLAKTLPKADRMAYAAEFSGALNKDNRTSVTNWLREVRGEIPKSGTTQVNRILTALEAVPLGREFDVDEAVIRERQAFIDMLPAKSRFTKVMDLVEAVTPATSRSMKTILEWASKIAAKSTVHNKARFMAALTHGEVYPASGSRLQVTDARLTIQRSYPVDRQYRECLPLLRGADELTGIHIVLHSMDVASNLGEDADTQRKELVTTIEDNPALHGDKLAAASGEAIAAIVDGGSLDFKYPEALRLARSTSDNTSPELLGIGVKVSAQLDDPTDAKKQALIDAIDSNPNLTTSSSASNVKMLLRLTFSNPDVQLEGIEHYLGEGHFSRGNVWLVLETARGVTNAGRRERIINSLRGALPENAPRWIIEHGLETDTYQAVVHALGELGGIDRELALMIIKQNEGAGQEGLELSHYAALKAGLTDVVPGTLPCEVELDLELMKDAVAEQAHADALRAGVFVRENGSELWPIRTPIWPAGSEGVHGRNVFNETMPVKGQPETFAVNVKATGTYKGRQVPYFWQSGKIDVHAFYGGDWWKLVGLQMAQANELRQAYLKFRKTDSLMQMAEEKYGVDVDVFYEPIAAAKPIMIPSAEARGKGVYLRDTPVVVKVPHAEGLSLVGIPEHAIKLHRLLAYRDPVPERNGELRNISSSIRGWEKVFHYYGYRLLENNEEKPTVIDISTGKEVPYKPAGERVLFGAAARYGVANRIVHHHLGGALSTRHGTVYQHDGHNCNPLTIKDYDVIWTKDDYDDFKAAGSLKYTGSKQDIIESHQEDDGVGAVSHITELAVKLNLNDSNGKALDAYYMCSSGRRGG